jgi:hypothetical protein
VYRRERFGIAGTLPIELLVCDRRFRPHELEAICRLANLRVTCVRPVALAGWKQPLAPDDARAKDILCTGVAVSDSVAPPA